MSFIVDFPALRVPERDATNAAWIIASLVLNEEVPIPAVSSSYDASFQSLASQLRSMGVDSSLRKLTFKELCSLECPVAILIREQNDRSNYFGIVLQASEDRSGSVTLLNSGLLAVSEISEDRFRAQWAGHALVPTGRRRSSLTFSFLMGVSFPVFLLMVARMYKVCTRKERR